MQAWIAAVPDWRREVARRLDALIVEAVPEVSKQVKWNSPMYGREGQDGAVGWFLGLHVFARYVKVTFFKGAGLEPMPPETSKQAEVRYLDIHETDVIDTAQFRDWVVQAYRLPGATL